MMKECPPEEHIELYTFDVYDSEKLDMDEFEPETHKLGAFIKHTDTNNFSELPADGVAAEPEFETEAEKIYVQDHDFVSILRQIKPGF
jgi:hypothetical protein